MTGSASQGRRLGWQRGRWCAYFWLVGWDCISLGLSVCVSAPNIEIHVPFGFFRIGREALPASATLDYSWDV